MSNKKPKVYMLKSSLNLFSIVDETAPRMEYSQKCFVCPDESSSGVEELKQVISVKRNEKLPTI